MKLLKKLMEQTLGYRRGPKVLPNTGTKGYHLLNKLKTMPQTLVPLVENTSPCLEQSYLLVSNMPWTMPSVLAILILMTMLFLKSYANAS